MKRGKIAFPECQSSKKSSTCILHPFPPSNLLSGDFCHSLEKVAGYHFTRERKQQKRKESRQITKEKGKSDTAKWMSGLHRFRMPCTCTSGPRHSLELQTFGLWSFVQRYKKSCMQCLPSISPFNCKPSGQIPCQSQALAHMWILQKQERCAKSCHFTKYFWFLFRGAPEVICSLKLMSRQ